MGIRYYSLKGDNSNFDKVHNIIPRIVEVALLARNLGADILAGIHPVHIANASLITGIPCIGFADTDHAIEQIALYTPGCNEIYTPLWFTRNLGKKQRRYLGFQELAYLHPNYFTPDKSLISEYGVLDNGKPIVLRSIKWDATHDIRVKQKQSYLKLAKTLSEHHRVIVSAEGKIPRQLAEYANPLPRHLFHHLLAYSSLYIGPGATTASESAILGTPAIYTNSLSLGYISKLERLGLVFSITDMDDALKSAQRILDTPERTFQRRRNMLIENSCDVAQFAASVIQEKYASTRRSKIEPHQA